jgi:hypothetical protein
MFVKQYNGWEMENSITQSLKCPHCRNTTDHFVYVVPHWLQFGLVFMSRPLLGAKKYFFACPTCGNLTREITKEQAKALVRS